MHIFLTSILTLACICRTGAQVFMRPIENSAALAAGGATVAYPGAGIGLTNEAVSGLGSKHAVFASSALPFGITDWQSLRVQALIRLNAANGFGFDAAASGIDAYREQQINLSYGRRLAEKFFLGGGLSLLRASAQEYGKAAGASFSLGVLAHALPKIWIGARVYNPVQQEIAGSRLPTILRIGAAWKPSELFVLMAETEKDLERPTQVKAGFEYRPSPALVLRAGVRNGRVGRAAFGAGLQLKNGLSLNASAEWHPLLGFTPAAMIAWQKI